MVALLIAYLAAPGATEQVATRSTDLSAWLANRVSLMDDSDPYRPPTSTERSIGVQALKAQEAGTRPSGSAAKIGITASTGTDAATGRAYSMLASETETDRAWGAVIVDRSRPVRLVIEIPHPKDDINTPLIGLSLFRKVPGSALVVAGSTRNAGTDADAAHYTDTMFQAYAGHLAVETGKEVQVHGFADASLPGVDAIPSPGPTTASTLQSATVKALSNAGLSVCDGSSSTCGNLRGTTNVQGAAAKARGSKFLHIETSRTVRESAANRATIVAAVAGTWG